MFSHTKKSNEHQAAKPLLYYADMFINVTGAAELYFAGMETARRDWTALEIKCQIFIGD